VFEIGDYQRYCLPEGLDDNGLTLKHEAEITSYEQRPVWRQCLSDKLQFVAGVRKRVSFDSYDKLKFAGQQFTASESFPG
jgi:hypothetical protein